MTERNGGQLAARQLKAAGIDAVFGVVAGPMIEMLSGAVEEGLTVVNCRHEVSAGLMASAWGWVKRKPGVCVVGSGPGMTNSVTPMHVATESAMPLVVLGGSTYGPTRGLGGFQEADQRAFARPACKWTLEVDSTERIPELVHLALGKARPAGPARCISTSRVTGCRAASRPSARGSASARPRSPRRTPIRRRSNGSRRCSRKRNGRCS